MARKITHTKRGTYYNGPTGRRKVSAPFGILFSAAGAISKASRSRKKRKSSGSYNFTYSGNSNNLDSDSLRSVWNGLPRWKKILNYVNMVVVPLVVIFIVVQMCSDPKPKYKHRKHYRHIRNTQFSHELPRLHSDFVCSQWKYE